MAKAKKLPSGSWRVQVFAGYKKDDEATLKRVYIGESGILLVAENPEYEPIHISKDDYKNVQILGKAVAFQSDIR